MTTEDEALKRRFRQFEAAKKPMSQDAFQAAYVARLMSMKRAAIVEADTQKHSNHWAEEQQAVGEPPEADSPPAETAAERQPASERPAGELCL